MKIEKEYYKNSDVLKWKRKTNSDGYSSELTYNKQGKIQTFKNSDGYSSERTYNEQGQEETYKSSNGIYAIKGKEVSKEEFEAFVNDEIIEVNGVKYKKL